MLGSIFDTHVLNDGNKMPVMGMGTDKLTDERQACELVSRGIELGYRYIDTADWYNNEELIGRAIKDCGCKREDIFLLTKLNNPYQGYESAIEALKRSLEKLDTDYVDMFLIHWPGPDATNTKYRLESWRALIRLKEMGLCRSIGVSNFQKRHIEQLIKETGVVPAVNQIERHPWQIQSELIAEGEKHGVFTVGWAPLMRGLFKDIPLLSQIGERYDKSAPQIILRWDYQSEIGFIPKTASLERLAENADIFDFELSEKEMESIDALDKDYRLRFHPDTMDVGFPESPKTKSR